MKKYILVIMSVFLALSLYAKTITLDSSKNENGEIVVSNQKGKVEDKIHIENNTDSNINIVINGIHKKKGLMNVASDFVPAHSAKFVATKFEEDLDDFKSFIVSLEKGTIISYKAEMAWSDFYFAVNETDVKKEKESSSSGDVDELLKWKKLLDEGVISQDEFNAKKNKILGL